MTVAFWVHTNPEGLLRLYIATPAFDPEKVGESYREVISAWGGAQTARLSLTDINLVKPDDPAARAALDVQRHRTPDAPIRVHDRPALGDLAIQEAYIYPRTGGALSPADVPARILHLMQRTGSAPSRVKLRDGSSFRGLPVGLRLDVAKQFELTFFDEATKAERVLPAEEVVAID
ncbi:MAG: hypothetical protein ACRC33_13735 [Gemmataceae bacterium]